MKFFASPRHLDMPRAIRLFHVETTMPGTPKNIDTPSRREALESDKKHRDPSDTLNENNRSAEKLKTATAETPKIANETQIPSAESRRRAGIAAKNQEQSDHQRDLDNRIMPDTKIIVDGKIVTAGTPHES